MNNALRNLFGDNFKSPFERVVLTICGVSGTVFLLMWSLPDTPWTRSLAEKFGGVLAACIPLFMLSFIILSVLFVGRNAGKKTIGAQASVTFGRVFLYVLLPCLLLTIGLLLSSIFLGWPPRTAD